MKLGPYLQLLIEDRPGSPVSVVVQKSTAQHFGWDIAFPGFDERGRVGPSGEPVALIGRLSHDERRPGGKRLRICRGKSRHGNPAGLTHCFRMRGAFAKRHLLQLAEVAGERFEWMENRSGKRIYREDWLTSN